MKSWQTTLAGIGAIMAALGPALVAQFDADPLTVPAWGVVIAATVAGVGLIFARTDLQSAKENK